MKFIARLAPLGLSALLVLGLAGCAAGPHKSQAHAHAGMGMMDMQAMCEMHKKMMSDPSHQAKMQDHMRSMAPEMRQRMMAMHEKCK